MKRLLHLDEQKKNGKINLQPNDIRNADTNNNYTRHFSFALDIACQTFDVSDIYYDELKRVCFSCLKRTLRK